MSEQASISSRIGKDIITAMKAKNEHVLTTLRMVKSALKNKEIDKREPLTDAEEQQILTTLIKQRRESVESFTKGDRPELAAKEQVEIGIIEVYLPQEASEEQIRAVVLQAIEQMTTEAGGTRPGPRELGNAMKAIRPLMAATGLRADGKLVTEILKAELGK